jgi:hypothetical protein
MDDWERFFCEKSERRSRREQRRRLVTMTLWTAIIGAALAGAIVGLMTQ